MVYNVQDEKEKKAGEENEGDLKKEEKKEVGIINVEERSLEHIRRALQALSLSRRKIRTRERDRKKNGSCVQVSHRG